MLYYINNREIDQKEYVKLFNGIIYLTPAEIKYFLPIHKQGYVDSKLRKQIANDFNVTEQDVNTYIARLKKKLAIDNRNNVNKIYYKTIKIHTDVK